MIFPRPIQTSPKYYCVCYHATRTNAFDLSLKLDDSGGLGSCHRDARTGLHLVCPETLDGGGDALDVFEKGAADGMM